MTLSADIAFEEYVIVDANAPLNFPHPWEFNDEIVVFANDVLLDIGADYSLTGAGAPGGGSINPVAATIGARWTAYRYTRLAQTATPADAIVGLALDRATKQAQDARRDINRSLQVDGDVTLLPIPLPIQPNKPLVGNATADGFVYGLSSVDDAVDDLEAVDAALAADIAAEAATRLAQDGALSAMITAESVARDMAVDAEAAARIAQDNILMGLITADGGLADPSELEAYLGIDVIEANLTAATSDITVLQAEMDTAQADILTKVSGPVSALDGSVVLYNGTTGKLIKDSATVLSAYAKLLLDDADAATAQTTLGGTTVGKGVFTAASAAAGQTALGITATAQTLLDDTSVGAMQTSMGMSTYIKTLMDDVDGATAQTTLGGTTVGKALFTAASASAAQDALAISALVKTLLDDTTAAAIWGTLGGAGSNTAAGGWIRLPYFNMLIQWNSVVSTVSGGGGGASVGFHQAFSNTLYVLLAMNGDSATASVTFNDYIPGRATSSSLLVCKNSTTAAAIADGTNLRINWIAVGY